MRITSGEWRGRTLKAPPGDAVRPTQDRVREALFSMLQDVVPGARVLDLFAGAGTVGFEALSRGAAHATFVEVSPRHLAVLRANAALLGCGARCMCVRADVYSWLAAAPSAPYDFVYADPPYALGAARGYADMLSTLARNGFVRAGGVFVAEMKGRQTPDAAPGWELVRDRAYGQTRLAVYRRTDSQEEMR